MTTILVAEDDPGVRAYLVAALSGAGYAVLETADGATALDAVSARRPAAVVADWRMPGVDGLALTRAIKGNSALAATRVVLLSGEYVGEASARAAGADAYLVKPVRLAALLSAVDPAAPAP
jgi:two-component system chemotaxis response regulator CheY